MSERDPDPARVVADVDVLAADLLVGGDARDALDLLRAHSWFELVVTEPLVDAATTVVERLADRSLAHDWRLRVRQEATIVTPQMEGHPALTAAAGGRAATVLSFDDRLQSPKAGAAIRQHLETSVKSPDAFLHLVDPASLYETIIGGRYPGPDRDPRR